MKEPFCKLTKSENGSPYLFFEQHVTDLLLKFYF